MSGTIELPANAALFIDLDGTLLDIAATPDAVVVPPDLPGDLRLIRARLGDALAIVTGRALEQIDALLPGVPYAVAGEHGGAIRATPDGQIIRADLPSAPQSWRSAAARIAAAESGVLLEEKARGFVLHFRLAPERGPQLRAALGDIVLSGDAPSEAFTILDAHMAWELKPRGVDKGSAVEILMRGPPFAGRIPVYIGDDVTDLDGMRVAQQHGGLGLRVQDVFTDASGVRAWLAELAR